MADHLRHISGAISLFSDAIPEIFDAVSRTRWSEPWLSPAQTNRRLQCSYWPPWWEVWPLAGYPRTLDVRTACKRAPGSAYQIISCRPSTLTCDGTSGDGGMFQTGANHKKSIFFFSLRLCEKHWWSLIWYIYCVKHRFKSVNFMLNFINGKFWKYKCLVVLLLNGSIFC